MEIQNVEQRLRQFGYTTKLQRSEARKEYRVVISDSSDGSVVLKGPMLASKENAYRFAYKEAIQAYLSTAVVTQETANDSIQIYHSRAKLTGTPVAGECGMMLVGALRGIDGNDMSVGDATEANNTGSLMDTVLSIPGVTFVEIHAYHVQIHKSPVFKWSEIDPKMIGLLHAINLGDEGIDAVPEPEA